MRAEAQAAVDQLQQSMALLRRHLDWDRALLRLEELNALSEDPDLWNDPTNAQKLMRERTKLDDAIKAVREIETDLADTSEIIELAEMDGDADMEEEAVTSLNALVETAKKAELQALLSGEADSNDTFVEIHAGAGGTEAQDWASMLFRMYIRWAESRGFKYETVQYLDGEEAGIKSATIQVKGEDAYGWLKTESGVHRLVRISPFDSNAKRHTSFASVWVYPVIDDSIDIEINEGDLKIDTYRASGAGGQHVNTTDSAVRITHQPSGIVVQCQAERSQHKNRAAAMNMLKARMYEAELRRREEEANAVNSQKTDIGWGHQIRSYVMQPYQMVKDLRTGEESGQPQKVLDGDLDKFMAAALAARVHGENADVADID
ncbi:MULTISPECIES: peptide chain release factor 2 [Kordiimonas]|uniref:peptide chain release factor 2 n=1 Tax=Kordiimonas TaxID=288021 RepID=UPI001FF68993|nr:MULTISPECIES: peptide chain release factor 2 [Kordiimonas]MCK0069861.1 peptide chain release factor 2 [Kordiimonas laminariae]UTW57320.1 peptide chain release factor 2 [Kordiimonas sp. SCSIO 12603]